MSNSVKNTIASVMIVLFLIACYHISTQIQLSEMGRERMKSVYHIAHNYLIVFFFVDKIFSIRKINHYKKVVLMIGASCLYFIFKIIINLLYLSESIGNKLNGLDTNIFAFILIIFVLSILFFIRKSLRNE